MSHFKCSAKYFSIFSFSCQILNFGEIQDGGQDCRQFDDVTGPPQRRTPQYIPHMSMSLLVRPKVKYWFMLSVHI